MSITLIELIDYIKRHIITIIICMIVAAVLGQLYFKYEQRYYASTTIKYTFSGASEGLNPKGESLDVYEMVSPTVIERAINLLNLNAGIENIRSSTTITPFIDDITRQKQEAMIENGEDFEYFPTEYTVTFSYKQQNGANYGVQVLNRLFEAYDEYIRDTYTNTKKIPNVFTNINYDEYDYIELCELYSNQIYTIIKMLGDYNALDSEFRSPKTGLSFGDLSSLFSNLKNTEYANLYSIVRAGCLSKNKEVLLKNFHYKIEQLNLTNKKKAEEANVSFGILENFYKKYREQGIASNKIGPNTDNNGNVIYEDYLSNTITTYDEIMTQYVDSGVEATNALKTIDYYNMLIEAFSNDSVPQEQKNVYEEKAKELITKMDDLIKNYIIISNDTLNDFNVYKGTEYIAYLSSVSVTKKLSRIVILLFSIFVGIAFGIVLAVVIEAFKKLREEAILNDKRKKLQLLEKGILPKDMDNMPPVDRALFQAISNEFKEFYLLYHPITDTHGKWVGAEALVRWSSKEFGTFLPMEFISIAEKYDILEILGKWILQESCKKCKEWNQTLDENFFVSVNFTLSQVSSRIFMDEIISVLNEVKLRPKNFVLEISAAQELNVSDVISQKLSVIKNSGIRIAVDGFDKGANTLDSIRNIPIDILKASATFIEDNADGLTRFANDIGIKLCAEMVENNKQIEILENQGIDYMQGFYFSTPVTDIQFEEKYRENHDSTSREI